MILNALKILCSAALRADLPRLLARDTSEFSEFTGTSGELPEVVGDFYLAIVTAQPRRRFRLSDWQQDITRKMNLLAQVSSLLQGEVKLSAARNWLEIR